MNSFDDHKEKILQGLKLVYQKLVEEKRKNNQEIVVSRGGKIVKIKP